MVIEAPSFHADIPNFTGSLKFNQMESEENESLVAQSSTDNAFNATLPQLTQPLRSGIGEYARLEHEVQHSHLE